MSNTAAVLLMRHRFKKSGSGEQPAPLVQPALQEQSRFRAWGPFIVMGIVMVVCITLFRLSPSVLIQVVMFAGLIAALTLAPGPVRASAFSAGAKHAGVIIFDLCGAGALGAVIGASALGTEAYSLLIPYLPLLAVPFLLEAPLPFLDQPTGPKTVKLLLDGRS